MPTREDLQSQIANLNRELTEMIDANRKFSGVKPVVFPKVSWFFTLVLMSWVIITSFFPTFNETCYYYVKWIPGLTLPRFDKLTEYFPLLGLLFGWYAVFWTMRWLIYRTIDLREYRHGLDIIAALEAKRREVLDTLRRLPDDDSLITSSSSNVPHE